MEPRCTKCHRFVNTSEVVSLGSYMYILVKHIVLFIFCSFFFLFSFSSPHYFTVLAFMISFMDFLFKTLYLVYVNVYNNYESFNFSTSQATINQSTSEVEK